MRSIVPVLVGVALSLGSPGPASAGSRLRPPPDVRLHPDRGMTFSRYSRTSHDQRLFKPLNQATRLTVMDPAIEPYSLLAPNSVYDPQSGQIRGSLADAHREIRRAQDASRGARRRARASSSGSGATTDGSSSLASRSRTQSADH